MCNESMIKKLQGVTIKIDRTTQRQMIDLANRIKDNFSFQHWDEIKEKVNFLNPLILIKKLTQLLTLVKQ